MKTPALMTSSEDPILSLLKQEAESDSHDAEAEVIASGKPDKLENIKEEEDQVEMSEVSPRPIMERPQTAVAPNTDVSPRLDCKENDKPPSPPSRP